ncbi:MAG: DUF1540 domain-containing protein [Acutalibacteraceae bacterium]|nr:DUF1540 domain-containing protein [Oscillospiraceae bacterium]
MDKAINGIHCNASNCIYHADDYKCTAGQIEIGDTNACNCRETLCATFQLDENKKHCGC